MKLIVKIQFSLLLLAFLGCSNGDYDKGVSAGQESRRSMGELAGRYEASMMNLETTWVDQNKSAEWNKGFQVGFEEATGHDAGIVESMLGDR